MRSTVLILALLGTLAASGGGAVNARAIAGPPTTVPGGAPIGHLQPRARQFAPRSASDQAEQDRMSIYDAQQQKLDQELDKQLNICRGC